MPFKNGKFIPHGKVAQRPGASKPTVHERAAGAPQEREKHAQKHGEPMAPHNASSGEKHVTETHPGKTQPHPTTGVHAVHAHHTGSHDGGGSQYTTHTHHDDGTVETRENRSQDEMEQDHREAFPPGTETAEGEDQQEQFSDELAGGIGGEPVSV